MTSSKGGDGCLEHFMPSSPITEGLLSRYMHLVLAVPNPRVKPTRHLFCTLGPEAL